MSWSPLCMGGDHEQLVRRAAAVGKPRALAERLLGHIWEPHATKHKGISQSWLWNSDHSGMVALTALATGVITVLQ